METRTRQEMATLYGMSCIKTLKRHLDKYDLVLEERVRLTPNQQLAIFKVLGIPARLTEADLTWVEVQLEREKEERNILPPPQIYDNLEVFYPIVFSIFRDKKEPCPIMPENTRLGHLTN